MQLPNLKREIDQIAKDKGIDTNEIIAALEEAMVQAAHKRHGADREFEARYNDELGEIEIFEFREVVEEITDSTRQILVGPARADFDPEAEVGDVAVGKDQLPQQRAIGRDDRDRAGDQRGDADVAAGLEREAVGLRVHGLCDLEFFRDPVDADDKAHHNLALRSRIDFQERVRVLKAGLVLEHRLHEVCGGLGGLKLRIVSRQKYKS